MSSLNTTDRDICTYNIAMLWMCITYAYTYTYTYTYIYTYILFL